MRRQTPLIARMTRSHIRSIQRDPLSSQPLQARKRQDASRRGKLVRRAGCCDMRGDEDGRGRLRHRDGDARRGGTLCQCFFGRGMGEREAADGGDDGGGALFHAVEGGRVGCGGLDGCLVWFDLRAAQGGARAGGGRAGCDAGCVA